MHVGDDIQCYTWGLHTYPITRTVSIGIPTYRPIVSTYTAVYISEIMRGRPSDCDCPKSMTKREITALLIYSQW